MEMLLPGMDRHRYFDSKAHQTMPGSGETPMTAETREYIRQRIADHYKVARSAVRCGGPFDKASVRLVELGCTDTRLLNDIRQTMVEVSRI